MNRSKYLRGTDVLGADTIPSAGATYADSATTLAVQTALKTKGYDPGSLDGIYGPKTSAAIKSMQSAAGIPQTGVIDYGVLMALGIPVPPASSSNGVAARPRSSSSGSYIPTFATSGGYSQIVAPNGVSLALTPATVPSFWTEPLWEGAPVKRWQGIFGAVAGLGVAFGIISAVRR